MLKATFTLFLLATPSFAFALSGPDFHVSPTSTRQEGATYQPSSGPMPCTKKLLGTTYETATPNGKWQNFHFTLDGSYTVETRTCMWGDEREYVVDETPVQQGDTTLWCPTVRKGPFKEATNVWPPRLFTGSTPEMFVYCGK
ncbi:hypothetical protein [Deinococcus cellulosilyticus]|uniref:Uncharacterized protein n=1 Tax=Deinococcus cellulosilyticus (strain DSM 18568 / NBRC 106333 / KACC 11606 / 5516J-15) TaxID=1223518 RepID=A0A511N3F8_DEIC1|nr:hypothetical protein [Deinococcus cellulosilyticus]GEM46921.1 hypothetical protein DC3_25560 [Deinococcus cellulosilyticus NBRC 106333 = KACC 11606]